MNAEVRVKHVRSIRTFVGCGMRVHANRMASTRPVSGRLACVLPAMHCMYIRNCMIPIFFGSLSAEQWLHAHEGLPVFRAVQTRYSDQAMCHERTHWQSFAYALEQVYL